MTNEDMKKKTTSEEQGGERHSSIFFTVYGSSDMVHGKLGGEGRMSATPDT